MGVADGGLLVEPEDGGQVVRVGGVGPASAPVGEPGEQDLAGEVIEWADTAGDDQLPVDEVDVTELELPDGLGAGGVHRGQSEARRAAGVAAAVAAAVVASPISSGRSGRSRP